MESGGKDMQDVFCRLTDKNREILLLIARNLKHVQEAVEQALGSSETPLSAGSSIHN